MHQKDLTDRNSKETKGSDRPFEWDGYCPESYLKGEKVRLRLNEHDFFESEKTGLQIAITVPGVQAVILKFRGTGQFKPFKKYADEVHNFEFLSPQSIDRFPFCDKAIFQDEVSLNGYITTIK